MKRIALVLIAIPAIAASIDGIVYERHNRNNGSIVSSGETREYLLYVPPSYDPKKPAPLIISLHGANGWPVQQMEASQWNRVADREGFLVVYPSGADAAGPRIWRPSDARFIADLIDKLEREYNIDRTRVYANGLSNGGGMSFVLSCALSNRIAAAGLVAAAHTVPFSWCTDSRAVPMIAFHGTADSFVPYAGGKSWLTPEPFPSIPAFTAKWAKRNRCGAFVDSNVARDVIRREYTNCADDAPVVLYTIRGGGHTWPGVDSMPEWFVGPSTHSIDATETMWAFFRAHPLKQVGDVNEVPHRVDGSR